MKNAYLSICYVCNEKCRFCPCSENEKSNKMITDLVELKDAVDRMKNSDVTDITISGGEPTLHPQLPELVRYIQSEGMSVTILTNSERFSTPGFMKSFLEGIDVRKLRVITTLHSSISSEHERANRTEGSFQRTVKGLLDLYDNDVQIIIKHCITKDNYKSLTAFYSFCDTQFDIRVDIQLCGIDYCGIPCDRLEREMMAFPELRPYLEELFEYHIFRKNQGFDRKLYCINMPLCSCDVIYWNYMQRKRKMYDSYKDPHNKELFAGHVNAGISNIYCKDCKAVSLCGGTYLTAFEAFENRIIKPFL